MALEATHVAQFAVAAVYFGLAGWLLYVGFSKTIHRVLALLFFLRGSTVTLNQLVTVDPANSLYWHSTRVYFFIATAFVILDFLIVYTWRRPNSVRRRVRQALAALFLVVETAYLLNHELVAIRPRGVVVWGQLGFLGQAFVPLLAVAGCWFAWLARNSTSAAQAKFHSLMALGFAVASLAEVGGVLGILLFAGWEATVTAAGTTPGALIAQVVALSTLPVALVATTMIATDSFDAGRRSRAIWQLAIPAATVGLPLLARTFAAGGEPHSYLFFSALPRAIAAILLGYALVRQVTTALDVIQLDLRAAAAVRRGTVGGILVAIFFVISESAAQIFSQFAATQEMSPVVSQLIGILGAAVLLVILHPLNRLGERLSTSILPTSKPLDDLRDQERARIYEEQVELAWADGSITRKERLLLDRLREQLKLPVSQAVAMESRAVKRSPM